MGCGGRKEQKKKKGRLALEKLQEKEKMRLSQNGKEGGLRPRHRNLKGKEIFKHFQILKSSILNVISSRRTNSTPRTQKTSEHRLLLG